MENILQKNIDITELSNFKTIATTRYFFEIKVLDDIDKLKQIIEFSKKEKLKILFIWWWTNLLFAFDIFDWIIIKNNLKGWTYDKNNKILEAFSAENISDIAINLFKNNQKLWKRFIWLPWTIWWAVFWNAWCFWLETANNFLDSKILNLDTLEIEIFNKKQIQFSYRNSILKENLNKYFLIKARFDLSKKQEKYHSNVDNVYFRKTVQPRGNTCGSFFKNPSKDFPAWKLIEEVWLKWYKTWWAFFSEIHANFVMNDWTWTYKDLINLIKLAQEKVKAKYNIELVPEVRIITN
jgi:UDP-N-acetylmuramate dehydrogenase